MFRIQFIDDSTPDVPSEINEKFKNKIISKQKEALRHSIEHIHIFRAEQRLENRNMNNASNKLHRRFHVRYAFQNMKITPEQRPQTVIWACIVCVRNAL